MALPPRLAPLVHALALGAVSWVLSEALFWAHWRDDATVVDALLTWLAYTVVSHLALVAARRAAVSTLAGLFLVGALYGWLVEGALAGTVLGALPIQLSWTGLAWHAPLTVCLGWYALPALLRARRPARALLAAAALGAGSGLWAAGYVHVPDGDGVASVEHIAVYVTALTAILAVAYLVLDRLAPLVAEARGRLGTRLAGIALLAWFGTAVVPAQPVLALVVPLLLALPLAALRGTGGPRALLAPPPSPLRLRDVAPLAVLPPAAVGTYAALAPVVGTGPVVAVEIVSAVGGAVALGASLVRVRGQARLVAAA